MTLESGYNYYLHFTCEETEASPTTLTVKILSIFQAQLKNYLFLQTFPDFTPPLDQMYDIFLLPNLCCTSCMSLFWYNYYFLTPQLHHKFLTGRICGKFKSAANAYLYKSAITRRRACYAFISIQNKFSL